MVGLCGSPKAMLIPENMGLVSWLPNWLMAEFRTLSSFVPIVAQKLDSLAFWGPFCMPFPFPIPETLDP